MRFGKLIDGELIYAPKKLLGVPVEIIGEDGKLVQMTATVSNPTAQQYLDAGYLPVYDDLPAESAGEGCHYEPHGWAEGVNQQGDPAILRVWAVVDDPDPEDAEISAEEALDIIFGGDENAVD